MQFGLASLEDCHEASDTVVVIDVIRAFTTAAIAFEKGARQIILCSTIEEAFDLRQSFPGSRIMGETGGLPVEGFDYCNSPSEVAAADVKGVTLIQRTSAGTQGVVKSIAARRILCASFVCARATARYLCSANPDRVTFVATGLGPEGRGQEDVAFADYLQVLLNGENVTAQPYLERVLASRAGRIFADPERPEFPAEDLQFCIDLDRCDFAMVVSRKDGLLFLNATRDLPG